MARDCTRWPESAREDPRGPEITRDHPRSPEITRDHPRLPEIFRPRKIPLRLQLKEEERWVELLRAAMNRNESDEVEHDDPTHPLPPRYPNPSPPPAALGGV